MAKRYQHLVPGQLYTRIKNYTTRRNRLRSQVQQKKRDFVSQPAPWNALQLTLTGEEIAAG